MALALALSGVAAAMMLRDDRRPQVFGTQHLAVFAQPARLHDERVRAQAAALLPVPLPQAPVIAPAQNVPPAIDYVPTAAIAPPREPVALSAGRRQPPAPAIKLVKASRDRATFRGLRGEIVVKRGGVVPGPGRVRAITRRSKE